MVVTSYLIARSEFSSTLTLPTFTRPANWSAILSMIGVRVRHGPHQGAQKSTSTGWPDWATSVCQFSVVNSCTFLLAIAVSLASWDARDGGRCPLVDVIVRPGPAANQSPHSRRTLFGWPRRGKDSARDRPG